MRSAILLRITARSAAEVLPQAGAAACAASSAMSTSVSSDRGISQNVCPVTGVGFSKYRPAAGATHSPPMQLSYRESKVITEPSAPGRAYTAMEVLLFRDVNVSDVTDSRFRTVAARLHRVASARRP